MATVAIHPPKTPVTKGSNAVAAATIPNVCKMPGAPFVPTPLPNIGRSALSPKGFSTKVKIEGNPVAIGNATFKSQGDIASKGTGGGLVSANTHGITKFIMPGSFTVKIEGKPVHLLAEPMLNNCGPSGSPPNAATMGGITQAAAAAAAIASAEETLQIVCCECDKDVQPGPFDSCLTLGDRKHECCEEKLTAKKGVGGERGYYRDGTDFTNGPRRQMLGETFPKFLRRIRGTCWPDACALDEAGNPLKFYDFKFGCPKDVPRWIRETGVRGPLAKGTNKPKIGSKQESKYRDLAKNLGMKDTKPEPISNRDC